MYLDPGFGGMLIQVIIVLVSMGGAIVFLLRKKIRNLFTKKDESTNATTSESDISYTSSTEDDDIIDLLDKKDE